MAEENATYENLCLDAKLLKLKQEIKKLVTTKSGKNNHSNFTYFQLEDFLPVTLELFAKYNIYNEYYVDTELETVEESSTITEEGKQVLNVIRKPVEYAYVYLRNLDKDDDSDDKIYRIKTAEASIYGASAVQNLGGKLTYMKRYVYMNLLDIVEPDIVDAAPQNQQVNVSNNITPYDMPKAAVTNMASARQQQVVPAPQPIQQSVQQPVSQPVPQPVSQPVPQPVSQPVPQAMEQPVSVDTTGAMTLETKTTIAQMLISKNLNPADTIHNIAKQLGTTVEALQESQKDEVIKIINNL